MPTAIAVGPGRTAERARRVRIGEAPSAARRGQGSRSGRALLPLVARTPYFCSGCPHNSSTKVPAGSLVGGGIGCHALVLMMDPDAGRRRGRA